MFKCEVKMSEEEEDTDAKRMEIVQALSELGESKIANLLFKKIEKKITFVSLPDWTNHQICDTYPKCDIRTIAFCCSPANPCPYRASVLRKLGLTINDYIMLKVKFGDKIVAEIESRKGG